MLKRISKLLSQPAMRDDEKTDHVSRANSLYVMIAVHGSPPRGR
jgi:hypothetical protein